MAVLFLITFPWVSDFNEYTKSIELPAIVRIPTVAYMFLLPLIFLASVYDAVRDVLGYERTMDIDDFCKDIFKAKAE